MIQRVILASSFFGTRQGVGRNHFRLSELLVGTTSDQYLGQSEVVSFFVVPYVSASISGPREGGRKQNHATSDQGVSVPTLRVTFANSCWRSQQFGIIRIFEPDILNCLTYLT